MPKKITQMRRSRAGAKPQKAAATKKPAAKVRPYQKEASLSAAVIGVDGRAIGRVTLPRDIFAAKINKKLLAQAVRVYLANQRKGQASTKTRGEVEGSTRKIYRQKGTGRARHGAIRAPIFVGGGIVFGPQPRDFNLRLPKKMKRQAVVSAIAAQYQDGKIAIIDGWDKLPPKTKAFAAALDRARAPTNTLLVLPQGNEIIKRGVANLPDVAIVSAANLNTYEILTSQKILLFKEAIPVLQKMLVKVKL
ncbi:MAG: 50S ribosomal protein L4 [Patescibacteria group bacterium]